MKEKAMERFYFFTALLHTTPEYSKSTSIFFNTLFAVCLLLLEAIRGFLTTSNHFFQSLFTGTLVWNFIPVSHRLVWQRATSTSPRIFNKNNIN